MGAWGTGNLENDTAGDWLCDLEENATKEFIEETLDAVFEEEFLDADISSSALAALEAVAFIKGNSNEDPEDFENIDLKSIEKELDPAFYTKAFEALGRILEKGNNELYELWEESESFEDWKNVVLNLQKRLKETPI